MSRRLVSLILSAAALICAVVFSAPVSAESAGDLFVIAPHTEKSVRAVICKNELTVTQSGGGASVVNACALGGGERNGVFNFVNLGGDIAKNAGDDVAPLSYNGTYAGGNHGNQAGIKITAPSHGKTAADIGSRYIGDNGVTVTVIRIIDENSLLAIGENNPVFESNPKKERFITVVPDAPLVHLSGGTNTEAIDAFTAEAGQQILPSVNNRTLELYADGVKVEGDGEYLCSDFDVYEEYYIIDAVKMRDYLIENAPFNENGSYCSDRLEGEVKYSVRYRFSSDGAVYVAAAVTALRDGVSGLQFGITQSQKFGPVTYVPFSAYDGLNPQSRDIVIPKSYWDDENRPPHKFYQFNDRLTKGFAVAYDVTAGDARPGRTKKASNAFICNQSGKMYPLIESGETLEKGETLTGTAVRRAVAPEDGKLIWSYSASDGSLFIEIELFDSAEGYIDVSRCMGYARVVRKYGNVTVETGLDGGRSVRYGSQGQGSVTLRVKKLNAKDANSLARAIVGKASPFETEEADFSGDGRIDAADLSLLTKLLLNGYG